MLFDPSATNKRPAEIKPGHCLHRIGGPQSFTIRPARRNRQNSTAQVIRITPITVNHPYSHCSSGMLLKFMP